MKLRLKELLDHDLWKRDLYLQDIDYIIGANIFEYDMKDAGYHLSMEYQLLDEATLEYLGTLVKKERTIRIGLLMRDNPDFSKKLTKAFGQMRRRFFIANDIQHRQILSIKKDAIFLINKGCDKVKFGDVEFVLKNRYTSFHRFRSSEFYYRNRGKVLDVKGISNDKLIPHEEYMISFLKETFLALETTDNRRIVSKVKKFASDYKNGRLPVEYYRELNSGSMYTFKSQGDNIVQSQYQLPGFEIERSYNYMVYILPLIQRFFFITN